MLQMSVVEEVGMVRLIVERVQGLHGQVSVEWTTRDGTAKSYSHPTPDYQVRVLIMSSHFTLGTYYNSCSHSKADYQVRGYLILIVTSQKPLTSQ